MINAVRNISFGSIKGVAITNDKDNKYVGIDVPDGQTLIVTGNKDSMTLSSCPDLKFQQVDVYEVNNDSALGVRDSANVNVKKVKNGHVDLHDNAKASIEKCYGVNGKRTNSDNAELNLYGHSSLKMANIKGAGIVAHDTSYANIDQAESSSIELLDRSGIDANTIWGSNIKIGTEDSESDGKTAKNAPILCSENIENSSITHNAGELIVKEQMSDTDLTQKGQSKSDIDVILNCEDITKDLVAPKITLQDDASLSVLQAHTPQDITQYGNSKSDFSFLNGSLALHDNSQTNIFETGNWSLVDARDKSSVVIDKLIGQIVQSDESKSKIGVMSRTSGLLVNGNATADIDKAENKSEIVVNDFASKEQVKIKNDEHNLLLRIPGISNLFITK